MALGYRASYLRWFIYTGCPILKNVSTRTDIFSRHLIMKLRIMFLINLTCINLTRKEQLCCNIKNLDIDLKIILLNEKKYV